MANKVKVGNKEISEDSQVVTNVKTILWFLSGFATILIALTTYFYFSLKGQIDENAARDLERSKSIKQEVLFEVKEVDEHAEKIEDDVWEIKGDVKLLLDRTNGINYQPEALTPVSSNPVTSSSPNPVSNAGESAIAPPPIDSLDVSTEIPD